MGVITGCGNINSKAKSDPAELNKTEAQNRAQALNKLSIKSYKYG